MPNVRSSPASAATESAGSGTTRAYRMGRRGDAVARTRRRILDAALALNSSVGPEATTMRAVAERAGVTRATLYRHFGSEAELLAAAQAEWNDRHRPPEPADWAELADPVSRLRAGLTDLYAWYRATAGMAARLLREGAAGRGSGRNDDVRGVPDRARAALLPGWPSRAVAPLLPAAIELATRFETWRALTAGGLQDDEAVELMARLASAAAGPGRIEATAAKPRTRRAPKAAEGDLALRRARDAVAVGPGAGRNATPAAPATEPIDVPTGGAPARDAATRPEPQKKSKSGKGKGKAGKRKGDRKNKG